MSSTTRASRVLERPPDGAVLDISLGGDMVYPLVDRLQDRHIRLVFATGYGDAEHPDALRDVPTITKPYGRADIAAAFAPLAPAGRLR